MEFCQRVGSKASTVSEIVGQRDEAVYQAIQEGIQRVNANAAARPYHIQKWAILKRDFSISGGELGKVFFSQFLGLCGRAVSMAVAVGSLLGSSRASRRCQTGLWTASELGASDCVCLKMSLSNPLDATTLD